MKSKIFTIVLVLLMGVAYAQKVGINVPNPTATLDVNGNLRLKDGTHGTGKILTSDAAGFATWQTPASSSASPSVGYGQWSPCENPNLCEYQPALDGSGLGNDGNGNGFGNIVAMNGDFAVVGASRSDIAGFQNTGLAYVYHFDGTKWVMMQTLYDPDAAAEDYFGSKVAINGNFIFVSSPEDDQGSNVDQGSVCIFQYSGSTWNYLQKIHTSDAQSYDYFGSSLAIDGSTAVVGCAYDSPVGSSALVGSATIYTYNLTTGFWIIGQKLFEPSYYEGFNYGKSVGLHNNRLIVGAPSAYSSNGTAYVYHKVGSSWIFNTELFLLGGALNDEFGESVDIFGDDIAISCQNRTVRDSFYAGMVLMYKFNGTSWLQTENKTLDPNEGDQNFGFTLDLSNGYLVVGSRQSKNAEHHTAPSREGKCIIYQKVNNSWLKLEAIVDPAAEYFEQMSRVAIDGVTKRFVLGAPYYQSYAGKVIFGKFKN
jgi:hypothetical protein